MKTLYYLMGTIVLSVFVLGIDFLHAANQNAEVVAAEEDAVLVSASSAPAAPVMLEGQTPNSAPVAVEPVNNTKAAADDNANNAGVVVIEEEAEEVDD